MKFTGAVAKGSPAGMILLIRRRALFCNILLILKEEEKMEQQTDEINKIIHIKCTEQEKQKVIAELSSYLYDYQFNFIIVEEPSQE